uniref:WAP domain-containing protein n=1 Tax=Ditylenchus dipsaci TaxID=166011 RepID=A0A915DQC6_9BILA
MANISITTFSFFAFFVQAAQSYESKCATVEDCRRNNNYPPLTPIRCIDGLCEPRTPFKQACPVPCKTTADCPPKTQCKYGCCVSSG